MNDTIEDIDAVIEKNALRIEAEDLVAQFLADGGKIQRLEYVEDRTYSPEINDTIGRTCPHCHETMRGPFMRRWHFNQCQQAPQVKKRKSDPKAEGKSITRNITCGDDLWNQCTAIAKANKSTMSAYVVSLIESDFRQHKEAQAKAP
jgi:hypothetical protein